jgi:isocitrate dehydrogenase kinase/phosphatase
LATRGAAAIRNGFDHYSHAFLEITHRAKGRFEQADWQGMQQDAKERLLLYSLVLDPLVDEIHDLLGIRVRDTDVWAQMRDSYSASIAGVPTMELAETFFNSVTRRIFATVGVNAAIEYVDFEFERVSTGIGDRPFRTYVKHSTTDDVVRSVLGDYGFAIGYRDLGGDAQLVAERIESRWAEGVAPVPAEAIDMLKPVFYRRKSAYLVGRVRGGNRIMPLVLALTNTGVGIAVDAALLSEEDVSVVFGFTRSYFHAAARSPAEVIEFLRSLMPRKPVPELYTALGHNKHGKTEFYRNLRRHLAVTDDRFVRAPGTRGMVMVVFTMPSYDVVFKVIRDQFEYPKQTTHAQVRRRYQLVFQHDRAGRLVDAQEFEHLAFSKHLFSKALLEELLRAASKTVRVEGDQVVISHLYSERRVRPLNLYLRDADPVSARRAVLDYGQAIRDLATTNVFPGDLLLKNFGVTRHGRVIFYDYDELCLLSDCNFREFPEPLHAEDELAAEPWFHVGEHDIFPEELIRFLELTNESRDVFLQTHSCLFRPDYWRELQARHAAGDVLDVFPYQETRRLRDHPVSQEE